MESLYILWGSLDFLIAESWKHYMVLNWAFVDYIAVSCICLFPSLPQWTKRQECQETSQFQLSRFTGPGELHKDARIILPLRGSFFIQMVLKLSNAQMVKRLISPPTEASAESGIAEQH